MYEWLTNIIEASGYAGIVFAMALENIFPPIPSELVMIFSGVSAATGDLNIYLVIVVGAIGSTVGILPWYYAGKWFGQRRLKRFADRHGRWLTFSGKDVDTADGWFKKHGRKMVFFGRFLPALRAFIAIPAAIMEMDFWQFILFAFLGTLIWDGLFGAIGYTLGENETESVVRIVDIASYIVIGAALAWYGYRVATFKKRD